jgi:hypothetical protein
MTESGWPENRSARKPVRSEEKLLLSRQEAAQLLSISERALDYLIANKMLSVRRIGSNLIQALMKIVQFKFQAILAKQRGSTSRDEASCSVRHAS